MKATRKYLTVLALLLISGGIVFLDGRVSQGSKEARILDLPLVIGTWRGVDYPVEERVKAILNTDYILNREYSGTAGGRVTLLAVHYPDSKIGFHRPEACNVGSGSQIITKSTASIQCGVKDVPGAYLDAQKLLLGGSRGERVIIYFFVSGDYITGSYLDFRLHMIKQQLRFKTPGGTMIQVHGTIEKSEDETLDIIEEFMKDFRPLLARYMS